ncbi:MULTISPECIES: mechanosensitive ion channel domain-containing protein [unclassified Shewanella]|uniref:mechanosensitive ion channel family protein n=1 Tax=unclassified Shewanella TaxID=196818 RepID=UPI000C843045|nr:MULTISPECIES: mechanosensitive ion channel domain-containing protein [unclassified Shewanella]MDO6680304.1 mechanosensitive ion channel [Shewanella sp. 4_MG-2023]MDO6775337.1 mechanosensitive ion channel [Shewanella sp. 3_MG-2023]PMG27332.1 mechanosensitive ion channel protein MscS [Shewanella sp. 10N.286.52.C2]PMG40476.1 mechanosensitive ion channel protein MscS [Shewanella sp. 10N.286.52.B9]PMH87967.1 mechanosensitive ion channel protein MscS [Shewanella sp. 10N.286.48.B5]
MNETSLDQELQQIQNVYDLLTEFIVQYSFQIVGAVIILLIGIWIANKVSNFVVSQFEKHDIDVTLGNFVSNLVRICIIAMVAIISLGKLGISVTPMVAAIGAASLGAGLALQGMLANYAAGVTIIVTRPFVIGNTIEIKGVAGVVKQIQLGLTILTNEEGELISIPNKHIVGEILHNSHEYKLVDTQFNIDYQTDPQQVIKLISDAVMSHGGVSQTRTPQVGINDFNSIGMEIGVRYWVPTNSYFEDKYQANLAIIKALKSADITIPCPVREIHLQQ